MALLVPPRFARQPPQAPKLADRRFVYAITGYGSTAGSAYSASRILVKSFGPFGVGWRFTNATHLNGVAQWDFTSAVIFDLMTNAPGTVHILLKPTASGAMNFVGAGASSTAGWCLGVTAAGNVVGTLPFGTTSAVITSNTVLVSGQWVLVTLTYNGNATASGCMNLYINGVLDSAVASAGVGTRGAELNLGIRLGSGAVIGRDFGGDITLFAACRYRQSANEILSVAANPWQMFAQPATARRLQLLATSTAASIGTLDKTLGAATGSASATASVAAALSRTLNAATSVAAGTANVTGNATTALGAATLGAASTLDVAAQVAKVLATASASAAAVLPVAGSCPAALAPLQGTITAGAAIAAVLAAPLSPAAISASGSTVVAAALASLVAALGPASVSAAGVETVAAALAGSLSPAQTGAAAVVSVAATLSRSLSPAQASAAGVVLTPIAAALSRALSPAGLLATASAPAAGVLARSLGAAQAAGAGTLIARVDASLLLGGLLAAGVIGIAFVPPPLLRRNGLHVVMRRQATERTMRRNPRAR